MTFKNDKLRDLTPLVTTFVPGESPTAEKLQGMMRQADSAIEYLENKIGDLAGEDGVFSTWVSTLARNIGDHSKLNPTIVPNIEVANFQQALVAGALEHELDMVPVGNLSDMLASTLDSSVVLSQYKNSVAELAKPGDWTIPYSYIEGGKVKRGRKLVTHAPAEGGSIVFKTVTSGRGSSLESSSENTIPNLAQAEFGGPFLEIEVVDTAAKIYQVTLPVRTKMYDKLGSIIDFTASNTKSAVANNSQYELPSFFFGLDGLGLDLEDENGLPKIIPLNLITLYDWQTKREIEGIITLQAAPTNASRKYQFIMQTKLETIIDTATGRYIAVVAGNPITNQLKALTETVYQNTGLGNDMTRLISHKNLIDLRTGSLNITNRSKYYGPSVINNNDHSMYLHRDGFTDIDKGAGGNILRGALVVGSTSTGLDDATHENFNIDSDSYSLHFGNIAKGPEIKYAKAKTYTIDHSYGGLPLGIVDAGLWIQGAISDLDPSRKNIFLEGDIRTSGNIILGKSASDVIFAQGKVYINDELTLIPRVTTGIVGEEGKLLYSSIEKAPVFYNGSKWLSPWNLSGYTTTIGDGINTFGKYNGTDITPFTNALLDVATGGKIKVLAGTYNFLANTIVLPANVTIEGSGDRSIVKGTGTLFDMTGASSVINGIKIQDASIGIKLNGDNVSVKNISALNIVTPFQITDLATNSRLLENITYQNCTKTTEYTGTSLIKSTMIAPANNIAYIDSTVHDWSLKDEVLKDYIVTSGNAVIAYDPTLAGSIGKGAFKITGDGIILSKKYLPVNVNLGVGGHLNINRIGTTGTVSVGVLCYDANLALIDSRYFILSSAPLTSATMDNAFYKGILLGVTGYNSMMFPANTRFVRPVMTISLNNGGIVFDSFEIMNLSYARSSSWA